MRIAINTLALHKTKVGMGKYIMELVNRVPQESPQNTYVLYVSEQNREFFTINDKNVTIKKIPKWLTHPFVKILWEQCVLPFSLWKNNIDVYHALGFTLPFYKRKKANTI